MSGTKDRVERRAGRPAGGARLLAIITVGIVQCLLAGAVWPHQLGAGLLADVPAIGQAASTDDPAEGVPAVDRVRELVDRYRRSGDDALLTRGWRLIDDELEHAAGVEPLLAAAWLSQAQHDFARADEYLAAVLARRADHGEAWLLRAAIALVHNDLDRAAQSCSQTAVRVPLAVTTACFGRVRGRAPGGADPAYRQLSAVLQGAPPEDLPLLGWLHGVAADLATAAGRPVAAAEHYRIALQLAPSVALRAGFADLLMRRGRAADALDLIEPTATAPALVLRRMLAQRALGAGPSARRLVQVEARFQAWSAAGDLRHAREMGRFYLDLVDRPEQALALARQNYRVQREPEDLTLLCDAARRVGAAPPDACAARLAGLGYPGPMGRADG